ncbi:hypothetical protein NKH77_46810 [Streptomyces sp. M19]
METSSVDAAWEPAADLMARQLREVGLRLTANTRASSTYFSEIKTNGVAAFNTTSTLPVSDFLQQRVRGGRLATRRSTPRRRSTRCWTGPVPRTTRTTGWPCSPAPRRSPATSPGCWCGRSPTPPTPSPGRSAGCARHRPTRTTGPASTGSVSPDVRGYVLRRGLLALLQCLVVLVAVFAVGSLLPGDTADVLRGELGTPEQVAALRRQLGLDEPAWLRFGHWLGHLFTGDLGTP